MEREGGDEGEQEGDREGLRRKESGQMDEGRGG